MNFKKFFIFCIVKNEIFTLDKKEKKIIVPEVKKKLCELGSFCNILTDPFLFLIRVGDVTQSVCMGILYQPFKKKKKKKKKE